MFFKSICIEKGGSEELKAEANVFKSISMKGHLKITHLSLALNGTDLSMTEQVFKIGCIAAHCDLSSYLVH